MIKKILAILAAIGGFFSAVFFLLFRQAKTEQKVIKAEAQAKDANERADKVEVVRKAENAVAQSIARQEAENEKLVERAYAGNNLESFSAGIDLLRKQSERGNKRNTGCSSSGA